MMGHFYILGLTINSKEISSQEIAYRLALGRIAGHWVLGIFFVMHRYLQCSELCSVLNVPCQILLKQKWKKQEKNKTDISEEVGKTPENTLETAKNKW